MSTGDPQIAAQIHRAVLDVIAVWWARQDSLPRKPRSGGRKDPDLPYGSVSALSRGLKMSNSTLDRKLSSQRYDWPDIEGIVAYCVPDEREHRLPPLAGLWLAWKGGLRRPPGYWGPIEGLDGHVVPAELSPQQRLQAQVDELQAQLLTVQSRLGVTSEQLAIAGQALARLRTELDHRDQQLADSDQDRAELERQREALAIELAQTVERLLHAEQQAAAERATAQREADLRRAEQAARQRAEDQATAERARADQAQARVEAANQAASEEVALRREQQAARQRDQQQAATERARADQAEAYVAELVAQVTALSERLARYEATKPAAVVAVATPPGAATLPGPGNTPASPAAPFVPAPLSRAEAGSRPPLQLAEVMDSGGMCRRLNRLYAQRRGPGRWMRCLDRMLIVGDQNRCAQAKRAEMALRRCPDPELRLYSAREHAEAVRRPRAGVSRINGHLHESPAGRSPLCMCSLRWCRKCRRADIEFGLTRRPRRTRQPRGGRLLLIAGLLLLLASCAGALFLKHNGDIADAGSTTLWVLAGAGGLPMAFVLLISGAILNSAESFPASQDNHQEDVAIRDGDQARGDSG
ncbi:hypothetical protein [Actinoplanes siamensis]|uniref:Uncharacterized protein n=1 Tax=Actinoplanes siamensis TaxID=1223317 RepID=A0A919NDU2_9ACTN|nr:hypothetical protein [Actinoplanes siamensis]GIF08894.1 hypothetical protein Asi03nite_64320 [Actinoplanes siamensis]